MITDFSIANTTLEERKEIVNNAMGFACMDGGVLEPEVMELASKYINGEKELKEIQKLITEFVYSFKGL